MDPGLAENVPAQFPSSTLVVPRVWHDAILDELLASPARGILLRVSRIRIDEFREEWIGREIVRHVDVLAESAAGDQFFLVRVHPGDGPLPYIESDLASLPSGIQGELYYGREESPGRAWGFVRTHDGSRFRALAELRLPGAGMERISLMARPPAARQPDANTRQRHLRTIAAFGADGETDFAKLRNARFLIAGVSRTGTILAEAITRWGASLALVDPKRLAPHHLGEISALLHEEDLGRPKTEALAVRLRPLCAGRTPPDAVVGALHSPTAVRMARTSDVLIDAGDADPLRVTAATLAVVLAKPHVSIASGVHFDTGGRRTLGADIRLGVPGSGRCMLCFGGLTDFGGALRDLIEGRLPAENGAEFSRARGGSLRSLNLIASGIALRLIEDLFAGRIADGGNRWVQVLFDEDGRLTVREPVGGSDGVCPLCAGVARGFRFGL